MSYIVNREAITSIDKEYVYIGDSQLPISRKYYKVVLAEEHHNL